MFIQHNVTVVNKYSIRGLVSYVFTWQHYWAIIYSKLKHVIKYIYVNIYHYPGAVPFSAHGADRISDVVIVCLASLKVLRRIQRNDDL